MNCQKEICLLINGLIAMAYNGRAFCWPPERSYNQRNMSGGLQKTPCYMPQLGFSHYFQNVDNFILEKCTNIKIMSIFV